MADCVLSNQNRFYVEREASFGNVPSITAGNRISALKRLFRLSSGREGGDGRLAGCTTASYTARF